MGQLAGKRVGFGGPCLLFRQDREHNDERESGERGERERERERSGQEYCCVAALNYAALQALVRFACGSCLVVACESDVAARSAEPEGCRETRECAEGEGSWDGLRES